MSGIVGTQGLPTVDRSALPADIRRASADDQKTYRTALGFEQTLMNELLKSVNLMGQGDSGLSSAGDDDDSAGSGAPAAYKDMVPTTLAQSVTAQGGLGLARGIYDSIRSQS